jgi:hypothetical protein
MGQFDWKPFLGPPVVTGGCPIMLICVTDRGRLEICLKCGLLFKKTKLWGFGPNLGLIQTVNKILMAYSKAHNDPDPKDPDGSSGLKLALEGILVPHTKDSMVAEALFSLVVLRDPFVGQGPAAKMARI